MKRRIAFSLMTLVITGFIARAQQKGDTTLKSTTIEVIQSYKPEVKQVVKPAFTPQTPPRDTTRPRFSYEVPQQALHYTYSSLPLRPLALGKDSTYLPYQGYLKLGGGNLSTIVLDAGASHLKGDNYTTSVHVGHLSQEGTIKNQKVSLTDIEAKGTLEAAGHLWGISLEGVRNRYHLYGYNHDLYDFGRDTVQQTYTGVQLVLDAQNQVNKMGFDYHPSIRADFYGDDRESSERTFGFDLPVSRQIDSSLRAGLGIRGVFTSLSRTAGDVSNSVFQITPEVIYRAGAFSGKLGIYPTFSSGFNSVQLLPDIDLLFRSSDSRFRLGAGWLASIRQNTFRELSNTNPYLFNSYTSRQTRQDEVFATVAAALGSHLSLTGRVSWWQYENLPLFLNDSGDRKNFYIVYDGLVQAISFEAGVRYEVGQVFSAGILGRFTSFNKKSFDRVWHEPGIRLKADLSARPVRNLLVTAYTGFLDQIYALNELHQEVKLDPVFDVGGGAEYQFLDRLSAFIQVNNLLNNRYQRWYGYETYGINFFGGLRLKY